MDSEIVELLKVGKKLEAIKRCQDIAGISFKDAKQYVEELEKTQPTRDSSKVKDSNPVQSIPNTKAKAPLQQVQNDNIEKRIGMPIWQKVAIGFFLVMVVIYIVTNKIMPQMMLSSQANTPQEVYTSDQQEVIAIIGKVKSSDGSLLSGATIEIEDENTENRTVSDSNGEFSIEVSKNSTSYLVVSLTNYRTRRIKVSTLLNKLSDPETDFFSILLKEEGLEDFVYDEEDTENN